MSEIETEKIYTVSEVFLKYIKMLDVSEFTNEKGWTYWIYKFQIETDFNPYTHQSTYGDVQKLISYSKILRKTVKFNEKGYIEFSHGEKGQYQYWVTYK